MAATTTVPVIICDDHPLVRHAIRDLIESTTTFSLVGEAIDSNTTIELIESQKPEILILDLGLPKQSGFEVLRQLKISKSNIKVLVLSMYEDESKVLQAYANGADAYLLKDASIQEITNALDKIHKGEKLIHPRFQHLENKIRENKLSKLIKISSDDALALLSKRERQIFYFLANGQPNRVIAKDLSVSPRTIETHRSRILKKFSFKSNADLIKFAIKQNLLTV